MSFIRIPPPPHIAVEYEGEGPVVIFLHGIGGNRTNWRAQLPAFANHFTAAAWDARGYGDSDDYRGALEFSDFGYDLLRVLDYFGAHKAHLVGLSMGGRIALDFWGRHPERVATLVLADTSAGQPGRSREQLREFLRIRQKPLLEGKTPRDIAPKVVQSLIGPSTPSDKVNEIIESLSALHTESYLKTLETVTMYHDFPQLNSINVPTLLIVGEEDQVATPIVMRTMAKQIAGAQFVEMPRTAHMSNIERPDEFNKIVLEFLRAHTDEAA